MTSKRCDTNEINFYDLTEDVKKYLGNFPDISSNNVLYELENKKRKSDCYNGN